MINEYHIHGDNNTIIVQQALPKEEVIVDNKLTASGTKLHWNECLNLILKVVSWVMKIAAFPLFINCIF